MEDKTFELLTKMYGEFTEFRKDMNAFRKETKEDIRSLKNDVLRIENEHGSKLEALFDGYKQQEKILNEHSKQLADVNNKLDYLTLSVNAQDKRLEVVEAKKKKAK